MISFSAVLFEPAFGFQAFKGWENQDWGDLRRKEQNWLGLWVYIQTEQVQHISEQHDCNSFFQSSLFQVVIYLDLNIRDKPRTEVLCPSTMQTACLWLSGCKNCFLILFLLGLSKRIWCFIAVQWSVVGPHHYWSPGYRHTVTSGVHTRRVGLGGHHTAMDTRKTKVGHRA